MAFFYVYVTGKNVNTIYPGILNQNLSFNWIFFLLAIEFIDKNSISRI